MIGDVKGKGYSESLQYIYRMTRKASVEITEDSGESLALESLPQSGAFFWNRIFDEIDVDGDGVVTRAEFERYITETQEEVKTSRTDGQTGSTQFYSAGSSIACTLLAILQGLESSRTLGEEWAGQNTDGSGVQIERAADRIFDIIDTDRDGSVKQDELADAKAQFLKRVQNSMDRLQQLELTEAFLNMLETAGSVGCRGGVLATQSSPSIAQTAREEAEGVFKKIDANLDGKISRDELVNALSKMRTKIRRTSHDNT